MYLQERPTSTRQGLDHIYLKQRNSCQWETGWADGDYCLPTHFCPGPQKCQLEHSILLFSVSCSCFQLISVDSFQQVTSLRQIVKLSFSQKNYNAYFLFSRSTDSSWDLEKVNLPRNSKKEFLHGNTTVNRLLCCWWECKVVRLLWDIFFWSYTSKRTLTMWPCNSTPEY